MVRRRKGRFGYHNFMQRCWKVAARPKFCDEPKVSSWIKNRPGKNMPTTRKLSEPSCKWRPKMTRSGGRPESQFTGRNRHRQRYDLSYFARISQEQQQRSLPISTPAASVATMWRWRCNEIVAHPTNITGSIGVIMRFMQSVVGK